MNQVELGINQRAVQIKYQRAYRGKFDRNHTLQFYYARRACVALTCFCNEGVFGKTRCSRKIEAWHAAHTHTGVSMAQVHPFRAFRYNPARAAFDRVLTQPYDKISPAMQEKYYAADQHNLITVEKGRVSPSDSPRNNVYTRASSALQDWIGSQVVVPDPAPAFYAYTQAYTVPGTDERRTRRGFIGAGKLEDYSAGVVFRHEHTLSGPKADRLELLRNTRTHTGQLFMLYTDEQRRIDAILADAEVAPPVTSMRDEYDVTHRLWVIWQPERVSAIQRAMADQKLVIADGHHRYETALNYRNEQREEEGEVDPEAPYERAMMTFVNTRSE